MDGWLRDYIRAECEFGTLELHARKLRLLRGGPNEVPSETELPVTTSLLKIPKQLDLEAAA